MQEIYYKKRKYSWLGYDASSGLNHARARYFDSSIGRFISEDTYLGKYYDPQSLNLYTYVHNNPLIYTDSSGHYCVSKYGYWAQPGACSNEVSEHLEEDKGAIYFGVDSNYVGFPIIENGKYVGVIGMPDEETSGFLNFWNDYRTLYTDKEWKNILKNEPLAYLMEYCTSNGCDYDLGSQSNIPMNGTNIKNTTKSNTKVTTNKGCNCFTAGTKVLTDEGEKPIEEIEVGDKVLAKSDETGEVAYKEVMGLFQKQADEIYKVYVGDEVIETTAEHPFWLDGKGWTEVKDLEVGDFLVTSDGSTLEIEKIEKEPREATVYNFEVEDYESYFVSNLGIWVHNCAVRIINKKYAGQVYHLSGDLASKYSNGVKFNSSGFPEFGPYAKAKVEVQGLKGNTTTDMSAANKAAGFGSTPNGYTWHHVEDGKTMMLVPTDLHNAVRHTGGAAMIRNGLAP